MNIIKLNDTVNERGFFSVILEIISIKILNPNIPFYVDLTNWTLYQDKQNVNVWESYFEQYFENFNTNVPIINKNTLVNYHDRFKSLNLIRENIKDLKIKKHILDKINKYDSFFEKKVLGVHKRGTDSDEHRPIVPINEYFKYVDSVIDNYDYLYVCSDEEQSINMFKERYKDKIFTYDAFRSDSKMPIHKFYNEYSSYSKGEEVLIEAILLSKCNYLYLTDSNVAFFSIYYNNNEFKFIDNIN